MTVKELIKELQKYPEDLKIWVSDNGYCEGAKPLKKVNIEQAYEASLDGDDVDDEYIYIDNEDNELLENIEEIEKRGYKFFKHRTFGVFSKQILMIYG